MEERMETEEGTEATISEKEAPERTVRMIQQDFASANGLYGDILWDLHRKDQKDSLIQKFNALIPNESDDVSFIEKDETLSAVEKTKKKIDHLKSVLKRNAKLDTTRADLIEKTWAQRKYCDGDLLMAIVYVAVTPELGKDVPLSKAETETTFSIHPLIRVRKCTVDDSSYSNCCMVFVDANSRVYQNWKNFLEDNSLPKGVMVAPANGVYSFDERNQVILECAPTPASGISKTVVKSADVVTGVAGMTAAAVPVAALLAPIAAPVVVGAGLVAIGSGLYSIARSSYHLFDRSSHEQSIGLTNREARGSWLGVIGGVVGVGASGATQIVGRYAAAGHEVSNLVQTTVNGINITSIVITGAGVGNGVVDIILKYKGYEDVTLLDFAQLGASLILFTHSVYNFQTASDIIDMSRTKTIDAFKEELSNRQRKIFNKMQEETYRIKGEKQGKIDIIRSLNNIPDKQYFSDIYKINQQLNENGVRPSFSPDGNVLLNNAVAIEASKLRESVQQNAGENILHSVNAPIPDTHVETARTFNVPKLPFDHSTALRVAQLTTETINRYTVCNEAALTNCIAHLFENLAVDAASFLIKLAQEFVQSFILEIERTLKRVIPFEDVLYDMFRVVIGIENPQHITKEFLSLNGQDIVQKVKDFYKQMTSVADRREKIKCKGCEGFYSITPLD